MPKAYVSNKDLLVEIKISHETGTVTRRLAEMIMLMAYRYSTRSNWRSYSYVDQMKDEAICGMIAAVPKFNPERSQNPFSYLTQVTGNCFLKVWKREDRQAQLRDDFLEEARCSPSTKRQLFNIDNQSADPLPQKRKPGSGRPKKKA